MKLHTVLIVDDQLVNRTILRKLLQTEYHVLEADNGQAALEVMRANAEELSAVLLDIVMPVLDGYGVLQAMQEDAQLSKIPVIVSSQKEGDEAEEKALALGAQDFVAKPYKGNIIRHRLYNTIRLRETAALVNRVEKDELTGLLSKQVFIARVAEELRHNPEQPYDILSVGVEHFKLVNDTFGMVTGDELLCHIGHVLEGFPGEVLSSRFTADRFYLLVRRREVYDVALLDPVVRQVRSFPVDIDINLNCGVYHIEEKDTPVNSMCDRAQLAADSNKGKFATPFTEYDDSLRQKLLEEQFIAGNMRSALEEKQFVVYYQPKYDLAEESVVGAEALVRWVHPTRGFLSPGEFIPVFEKNGFITSLDEYVWETVCSDIRDWMEKGFPPVAVSVNVSRADVYNPHLTDILLSLVAKYKIPIRYLHLEITESAYTNNPDQIIRVVSNLRKLGFLIEMDDFGSGYSSLNMLSEMPVDVLKLDMGFVQHETMNTSGKGIMSFVISLAKWLDLAVVAEGVETASQISMLRSMDCNYVQGFYYAKPLEKSDFENLMKCSSVNEMLTESKPVVPTVSDMRPLPQSVAGRVMLIVDDIELNRAVLASTFEGWFTIVEKENGQAAWEYLQENMGHVALVLLDLLMPVMDGFQLLEKIRANEVMKELPVIITSQGDTDSEQRALQMNADDFISKPYNPDVVKHRVRNVVEARYLRRLQEEKQAISAMVDNEQDDVPDEKKALQLTEKLHPFFDIVRIVDPEQTFVQCDPDLSCDMHACYSVWGKTIRCNNCVSLRALREKTRTSKLEYSNNGLYFVSAQYVPYGEHGAVLEMVTKLEDEYVDNVMDKQLLYARLDALNLQLNVDEMTGVYNRRYIDENLPRYITSARKRSTDLGVAMVDVDAFKALNDLYGHQVGDEALRIVAAMLRDNIAQSKGDFAARYGGDEFLVVCRDISKAVFVRRLKAVAKLVRYITVDGKKVPISISAGCVSLSENTDADATALINWADRRLYRVKIEGRGNVRNSD